MSLIHAPASNRSGKMLAILATASAASDSATQAADLGYISPVFNSDNIVGWQNSGLQLSLFPVTFTGGRQFQIRADMFDLSKTGRIVFANRYDLNASTFRIANYSNVRNGLFPAIQFFNAGQTFGSAENPALTSGRVGKVYYGTSVRGAIDSTDRYLLFEFRDDGEDYFGWVHVDVKVGANGTFDNYLRIRQYAWQASSVAILAAGATPVPEPSTLVTSGIAALSGGAAALRRWRKERKAKTEKA